MNRTLLPGVLVIYVVASSPIKWCLTAEFGEYSWVYSCNTDNWPYLLHFRKTSPKWLVKVWWQVSRRHWNVQLTAYVTDPLCLLYSDGVCYKWVPEKKEMVAMNSDPLLLGRKLRYVFQPEVNPQLYHRSCAGCVEISFVCLPVPTP